MFILEKYGMWDRRTLECSVGRYASLSTAALACVSFQNSLTADDIGLGHFYAPPTDLLKAPHKYPSSGNKLAKIPPVPRHNVGCEGKFV